MKTDREIELENEVKELSRKLAEQQATVKNFFGMYARELPDIGEELNTLLSKAREEGRKEAAVKFRHVCNLWIDPETAEIIVDRCDHEPSECTPAYITEWVKP